MKSFTSVVALAASIALVRAQATFNETTGAFQCSVANGTFCAGDSLSTNIIVRCTNFIGQPGNCDDNLDGEFPQGDSFSPCWASSPTSGIAACSKNCVVYGDSGDSDTFTLPNCVPTATPSSTTVTASASTIPISINATSFATSTTIQTILPIGTGSVVASSGTGLPPTYTTTGFVPFPTNGTSPIHSSGTGFGGSSTSAVGGGSGESGSATATPKSPPTSTHSPVPTFTGGANTAKAGSALAAIGFFVAAFL